MSSGHSSHVGGFAAAHSSFFYCWSMFQRALCVSNQDMGVILADLCIEPAGAAVSSSNTTLKAQLSLRRKESHNTAMNDLTACLTCRQMLEQMVEILNRHNMKIKQEILHELVSLKSQFTHITKDLPHNNIIKNFLSQKYFGFFFFFWSDIIFQLLRIVVGSTMCYLLDTVPLRGIYIFCHILYISASNLTLDLAACLGVFKIVHQSYQSKKKKKKSRQLLLEKTRWQLIVFQRN